MLLHLIYTRINKLTFIIVLFVLSFAIFSPLCSCEKEIGKDELPPFSRVSFLIYNIWGLTPATSIDSLSTGSPVVYKRVPVDSLDFAWGLNPNVDIYGINSFIGGTNTQYNIDRIGENISVSSEYTSAIALLILLC